MEYFSLCLKVIEDEKEKFDLDHQEISKKITELHRVDIFLFMNSHERCAFMFKYATCTLSLIKDCVKNFLTQYNDIKALLQNWKGRQNLKFCSTSQGPALDYVALTLALSECVELDLQPFFSCVNILAKSAQWKYTVDLMMENIKKVNFLNIPVSKFSDLYEVVEDQFISFSEKQKCLVQDTDVVFMVKTLNLQQSELQKPYFLKLIAAMKTDSYLFFFDTKPGTTIMKEILRVIPGVFLYGPFSYRYHLPESFPDSYKSIFGVLPTFKSRGQFFVWKKLSCFSDLLTKSPFSHGTSSITNESDVACNFSNYENQKLATDAEILTNPGLYSNDDMPKINLGFPSPKHCNNSNSKKLCESPTDTMKIFEVEENSILKEDMNEKLPVDPNVDNFSAANIINKKSCKLLTKSPVLSDRISPIINGSDVACNFSNYENQKLATDAEILINPGLYSNGDMPKINLGFPSPKHCNNSNSKKLCESSTDTMKISKVEENSILKEDLNEKIPFDPNVDNFSAASSVSYCNASNEYIGSDSLIKSETKSYDFANVSPKIIFCSSSDKNDCDTHKFSAEIIQNSNDSYFCPSSDDIDNSSTVLSMSGCNSSSQTPVKTKRKRHRRKKKNTNLLETDAITPDLRDKSAQLLQACNQNSDSFVANQSNNSSSQWISSQKELCKLQSLIKNSSNDRKSNSPLCSSQSKSTKRKEKIKQNLTSISSTPVTTQSQKSINVSSSLDNDFGNNSIQVLTNRIKKLVTSVDNILNQHEEGSHCIQCDSSNSKNMHLSDIITNGHVDGRSHQQSCSSNYSACHSSKAAQCETDNFDEKPKTLRHDIQQIKCCNSGIECLQKCLCDICRCQRLQSCLHKCKNHFYGSTTCALHHCMTRHFSSCQNGCKHYASQKNDFVIPNIVIPLQDISSNTLVQIIDLLKNAEKTSAK